jgi:hypothetical protein
MSNDLETKLRTLIDSVYGPAGNVDVPQNRLLMRMLKQAAALGAADAYIRCAQQVEGDCDCQSYADDFRALAHIARAAQVKP